MISTKLVQVIEDHWEEMAARLMREVRKHPEMPNLSQQSDAEFREWCRSVLKDLAYSLSAPKGEEIERRFQVLGGMRFEENIPLHEAVLRLHILKDKIIGFVHEQGFPMTAMNLYAEEELELRIGRFFDACVYHVVRGYEGALSRAQRMAS
ncbi:MAG: hypothetical protein LAP87_16295 [Acidobacteriia bacterium]|nr:hypothetical protein [Terriglobia bacterium]